MEFNFSLSRLLLFAALLTGFAAIGGFTPLAFPPGAMVDHGRMQKAWSYCVLLFLSGAISTSLVDHFVGNIDRSNIRPLYVVLGCVLMLVAGMWLNGIHSAIR